MKSIFLDLETKLCTYNKNHTQSLASKVLPDDYKFIHWWITSICNYDCFYCGTNSVPKDFPIRSCDEIQKAFNSHANKWIIIISGIGEPFLYPDFLYIIKELSKKHSIIINTNLSSKLIYELPQNINKENLILIHCAFHVLELEKRGCKDDFIDKVLFLKSQGLTSSVSYVAYPPLLGRIRKDFEMLRSKGIDEIMAKPFIGYYKNLKYPTAYTNDEWKLLSEISSSMNDVSLLDVNESYYGYRCDAGDKALFINHYGEVFTCSSSSVSMGNFFSEKIKFKRTDFICKIKETRCLFSCVLCSKYNEKRSFIDKISLLFK